MLQLLQLLDIIGKAIKKCIYVAVTGFCTAGISTFILTPSQSLTYFTLYHVVTNQQKTPHIGGSYFYHGHKGITLVY